MMRALLCALHPRVAEELAWRWQMADGDMGLSSNFAPMVAMIERGGPVGWRPGDDIDERALCAAERARLIDRALAALSTGERDLLSALCAAPEIDRPALLRLSRTARALHRCVCATRPLDDWFERLATSPHEVCADATRDILDELEAAAERASRRYAALRGFPAHLPVPISSTARIP